MIYIRIDRMVTLGEFKITVRVLRSSLARGMLDREYRVTSEGSGFEPIELEVLVEYLQNTHMEMFTSLYRGMVRARQKEWS